MAIAVDATGGGFALSTNTVSWSHTFSGSNRIAWIEALALDSGGSPVSITSVTVDGVGATQAVAITFSTTGGGFTYESLWYLVAPNTGTVTITVTASASTSAVVGNSASYTGAAQTGVPDNFTFTQINNNATVSRGLTPVADNCWEIAAVANAAVVQQAVSGCVARVPADGTAGNGLFDTNGPISPPASAVSFVVGSVDSSNQNWGLVMASFAPFVTATDTYPGYQAPFGWH